MLSNIENKLMSGLYKLCKTKGTCLVSVEEIYATLPKENHITLTDVEKMLKNLAYDGYLDMVTTEKKGKFYYCITLKEKGLAFPREKESRDRELKRAITIKVILTVGGVILGGILTLILAKIGCR